MVKPRCPGRDILKVMSDFSKGAIRAKTLRGKRKMSPFSFLFRVISDVCSIIRLVSLIVGSLEFLAKFGSSFDWKWCFEH